MNSMTLIILVIVVAVVILVLISLTNRTIPKGIDKVHFKNEWNDIILASRDPKSRPMSIISADKLLDQALKCLGYQGNTMAERMVAAKYHLKHRDEVWASHKLRNRIVHESMLEPSEKTINNALNGYHRAFKDLGVF